MAQLEGRPPRHRLRSLCAFVLLFAAAVLTPLSVVASWAAAEVGDTDRYVATVAPLARDPAVQDAVATRVTDAVMQHLDSQALLRDVLPDDRPLLERALEALDDEIRSGLRGAVHTVAQRFVASDAFAAAWEEANRAAHTAVDRALTGKDDGAVEVTDDAVTIDLAPVVARVRQQLIDQGLSIARFIPEVHTQITIVSSDEIRDLRPWFRLLQLLGWWLPVIVVVLLVAGVLVAVRRRRALVGGALGAVAGAVVLGIALSVFRVFYLDNLPVDISRAAAGAIYDRFTHFLRTAVRAIVVAGLIIAVGAWVGGPGRRAGAVRQVWDQGLHGARGAAARAGLSTGPVGPWVHRYRRWLNWAVVAVAAVVYILWRYPSGWTALVIVLCALVALAVVTFLDEEPRVGPGDAAGAGPGSKP